jgi:hypothetical protein
MLKYLIYLLLFVSFSLAQGTTIIKGKDSNGNPVFSKLNETGYQTDFYLEVARGNVLGYSFIRKFGEVPAVQADTPADIWEYGATEGAELYTWSANGVADIDRVSSSSLADTNIIMTVEGLDVNGYPVVQNVTLNGRTAVVLDSSLNRFNRAYNTNGINFAGNIYIYADTTLSAGVPVGVTKVRGYIAAGKGQTLQSVYTVPRGYTAYFLGLEAALTKGVGATAVGGLFSGKTREYNKVFRIQDTFNLVSSGSSDRVVIFPIPLPFAERTDFCPQVDVTANGVGFSLSYTLLLIEN